MHVGTIVCTGCVKLCEPNTVTSYLSYIYIYKYFHFLPIPIEVNNGLNTEIFIENRPLYAPIEPRHYLSLILNFNLPNVVIYPSSIDCSMRKPSGRILSISTEFDSLLPYTIFMNRY